MEKRKKDVNESSWNIFRYLLIGWLVYCGAFVPFFLIIANAEKLKNGLFILAILLYFSIFIVIAARLTHGAQMRRLRGLMGDEAFFAAYPRERKKELRKWRRVHAYRENAASVSRDEQTASDPS